MVDAESSIEQDDLNFFHDFETKKINRAIDIVISVINLSAREIRKSSAFLFPHTEKINLNK
jgi:hypothetical protein